MDGSAWCAFCFNEPDSERVVQWLTKVDFLLLGTLWWAQAEFASALGIQLRRESLTPKQGKIVVERFIETRAVVTRLNVIERGYLAVGEACADAGNGLRGGRALRPAIAQPHGCGSVAVTTRADAAPLGLKSPRSSME